MEEKKFFKEHKKINVHKYNELKYKIKHLSSFYSWDLQNEKKLKKQLSKFMEEFKVSANLKPIVTASICFPNESKIMEVIEEALDFGCRIEDVPKYIQINYHYPKSLVSLKLEEMSTYKEGYPNYDLDKVFRKIA